MEQLFFLGAVPLYGQEKSKVLEWSSPIGIILLLAPINTRYKYDPYVSKTQIPEHIASSATG
jgi:hypothetical protein